MPITSESQALKILDDDRQDPLQRELAARYLEHYPAEHIIGRLVLALQDDDQGVRRAAAEGLARLGPAALPELLMALKDPSRVGDPRLRRGAYLALHRNLGSSELAAPLISELKGFMAADIGSMIEADHLYWHLKDNDMLTPLLPTASEPAARPAHLEGDRPIEIPVNADVNCTDGPAGRSKCVIINPVTEQVTHLVVEEKDHPFLSRLVPVDMVQKSAPRRIDLHCTQSELTKQKPFIETEYLREPVPYFVNITGEYVLWPYIAPIPAELTEGIEQIPPGELAVRRGTQVIATDGHVGRVDEFLVNPKNGSITHLVMREGHLWGQKDVTIPVSQIDRIEEDNVFLKLDKGSIEALPTVPVHRKTN